MSEIERLELELATARAKLANGGREKAAMFLKLPAVMTAVGMSRTTIYQRIKDGTFPKPVQIGSRAVAWDEAEVAAWQQSLARGVRE